MTCYYCTRCDSEHCPKTQNADESLVKGGPAVNKAWARDAQEVVDLYKEEL